MPRQSVQDEIKIGTTVNLKDKEKIERELAELVAKGDYHALILRLAQLGRMDEAQERLEALEAAYKGQNAELRKQLEDLQKPPLRDAVYLKPSPDAPDEIAIVGIGGTRMEVVLAAKPPVAVKDLPGCEVWVNGENQIVKFREGYVRGEATEVVEVLDDCRLRVKAQGRDEIIVERLAQLQHQTVEVGDTVRINPSLGVAFEKLAEKEKKTLEPEHIPDVRYEQIGGLDSQIEEIKEAIEHPFLYRGFFRKYGLKRPKGILLHGPPGCGKTMVAKAIANSLSQEIRKRLSWNVEALEICMGKNLSQQERVTAYLEWWQRLRPADRADLPGLEGVQWKDCESALRSYLAEQKIDLAKSDAALDRLRKAAAEEGRGYFLSISGPELLNKYVGETEYSIRRIFMMARKKASADAPVVIFFDELESMFSRRGSGISSDMESTVVPQLLSEIDGLEELNDVIIIGASNRYDLIDPAVLRPGRLDLKIYIGRPNPKSAAAVLSKYLTPSLPFAATTLEEFGGSAERASSGLISRTVDTIYSPNSYLQIYEKADQNDTMNRERRMPLQKRKAVSEIINGAMLESMVTRAKRSAVRREIEQPDQGGLRWQEDMLQAIRVECEESKEQYISELRSSRDIAGIEAFAVDVHLDDAAASASTKPDLKWFKGKARAWAAS